MPQDYITVPLSKYGKHRGKFTAIVDPIDADLANLNWSVSHSKTTHYAKGVHNGKHKALHREVLARKLERTLLSHEQVDHINMLGWDNRRENLRLASNGQNMMNRKRLSSNTSGVKGIDWYKKYNKWRARITVDGQPIHIGYFDSLTDAKTAWKKAAKKYHKEFANHGDLNAN